MNTSSCRTRVRVFRVVVVGLVGSQFSQLQSLCATFPVSLDSLTPEQLLRRRNLCPDLLVLTRFVCHKHTRHAQRVTGGTVCVVGRGTAAAVAKAISDSLEVGVVAA